MEFNKYHVFVEPPADRRFATHIELLARVSENAAVRKFSRGQTGKLYTLHTSEIN